MQTIEGVPREYTLTRWFLPIYEAYSVEQFPKVLDVPKDIRTALNVLHKKAGRPMLGGGDAELPPLAWQKVNERKAFISFAGGKDALAVAIRAEQDGFKPTLVYVGGINKVVPSERKAAEKVARLAGYPLVETKINIKGQKDFGEHPLKNVFILCLLIDIGRMQGATAFGQGNIFEDDSTRSIIEDCMSDSTDLLRMFVRAFRKVTPPITHLNYLHDNLQSFYIVWKNKPQVIPHLSTCNMGDFRRPMRRKYIAEHYGAEVLPPAGCGGCYKCAYEYKHKEAFGLIKKPNVNYSVYCSSLIREYLRSHDRVPTRDGGFNNCGGQDTEDVQVLKDVAGYYIGRLEYVEKTGRYVVRDYYGHKHYETRQEAEQIKERFKTLWLR